MLTSLFNRYRLWLLKRQTTRILHGFDDRQLYDVGTVRDGIGVFVDERVTLGGKADRVVSPRYRIGRARVALDASKQVMS
ncbi:hypothetical protein [Devosia sp. Root635]|uniref:hypothetical protein n=1 Tax=Devosia sp. Root635 TaxID=1736575 RepID=UPI000AE9EFBA|nr:hypothetical protein [Devosia sp. Root635]